MRIRRSFVLVGGLLFIGLLGIVFTFARYREGPEIQFPPRAYDFEFYDSVEAVVDRSDTIVVGTVGRIVDRQVDDLGFPDDPQDGNPVVLQEILVREVLRNDTIKAGERIVTVSFDKSRIKIDEQRPLAEGENIIFLAVQLPKSRTPGIRGFNRLYGRIGADSSVYDLDSTGAFQARDAKIKTLPIAGNAQDGITKFKLENLRELVLAKPKKPLVWGPIKE